MEKWHLLCALIDKVDDGNGNGPRRHCCSVTTRKTSNITGANRLQTSDWECLIFCFYEAVINRILLRNYVMSFFFMDNKILIDEMQNHVVSATDVIICVYLCV